MADVKARDDLIAYVARLLLTREVKDDMPLGDRYTLQGVVLDELITSARNIMSGNR